MAVFIARNGMPGAPADEQNAAGELAHRDPLVEMRCPCQIGRRRPGLGQRDDGKMGGEVVKLVSGRHGISPI